MNRKKSFRPANPFIVTGKIPAEYFCDRKDESRRLVREITNGSNVVLFSPRRMGKTGLIQYCFDLPEIADNFLTFYIDILQTSSLKEFIYLLGREVFNGLAPHGQKRLKRFASLLRSISGSFGFDPISGLPTFNLQLGDITAPEVTLEEIFSYLAESETPVIVAIDEFQQIATYADNKNVEALLRSHIQKLDNARFIFAGSERHMLRQMFLESAHPFYNSASILELKAIAPETYADFALQMFGLYDKKLLPEAVATTYKSFDGNTFYLQKTLNLAFSMTAEGQDCPTSTVIAAIADILASFDTVYREMLSSTSDAQKQLLLAVAAEGVARSITSSTFIKKHSLTSASSVQAAMRKLTERGLLLRLDRDYRVQDPLLRLWLLLTYGVGSVSLNQLLLTK